MVKENGLGEKLEVISLGLEAHEEEAPTPAPATNNADDDIFSSPSTTEQNRTEHSGRGSKPPMLS